MTNNYLITIVFKDKKEHEIKLLTEDPIKNVETAIRESLINTRENWISIANYFICKDDITIIRIDYDQHIKEGQDKKKEDEKA